MFHSAELPSRRLDHFGTIKKWKCVLLGTLTNQKIILDLLQLLNCTIVLIGISFITSKAKHMHTQTNPDMPTHTCKSPLTHTVHTAYIGYIIFTLWILCSLPLLIFLLGYLFFLLLSKSTYIKVLIHYQNCIQLFQIHHLPFNSAYCVPDLQNFLTCVKSNIYFLSCLLYHYT